MSIKDLQLDVEEITQLLGTAQRTRVRQALLKTKDEIEREIVTLEIKQRFAAERAANSAAGGANGDVKRYRMDLTEYAWDQSAKFVKFFINVKGVQNCPEEAVTLDLQERSMQLYVRDLNGKDYSLVVNNLLEKIDVEGSYRKIKTDMVAVYLKKSKPGEQWSHLTTILQRVTQNQKMENKDEENPEAALVNIMKKMYNEGDSKTKQMIAKAWTESQDKARGGGQPSDLPM